MTLARVGQINLRRSRYSAKPRLASQVFEKLDPPVGLNLVWYYVGFAIFAGHEFGDFGMIDRHFRFRVVAE